ncbi:hypothetical protein FJZ39_01640 [Candidatus Saccharibacteria bacterium]|nr:hypothetical protein [Candidatus Saccharibacteria bacterium]
MKNRETTWLYVAVFTTLIAALAGGAVHAASSASSRLSQQINAGVLGTDIRNSSNAVVASPSFSMGAASVSTSGQTVTGTFGTASQRISVDNPGGANGGWTLTLNATTPGTGAWTSGSNTYAYNGTTATGQLTVNPSVGAITAVTGGSTGVTRGASQAFTGTAPVTLMTADATSADIWNGYITGVGLSQTVPAAQPAGTYTIDLTQTVAAS